MATVRQSITALYEEAQRSAVEGAPMLDVLQSGRRVRMPCRTGRTAPFRCGHSHCWRFEELRRLAELEAGPAAEPSVTPTTDETRFDAPNDPLAGIELSAGFGDRIQNDPADDAAGAAGGAASDDVDGDGGVPAIDDNSSDILSSTLR